MKWFRLYADLMHDPKAQQLPDHLFKFWINLLCLAAQQEKQGALPSIEDISFTLRVSQESASEMIAELTERGLLDKTKTGIVPHNWNVRQHPSDNVTKRVNEWRKNNKRNVACNNDGTLHETEMQQKCNNTEQNREEEIREEQRREEGARGAQTTPKPENQKPFYSDNDPRFHTDYFFAMCEAMSTTPQLIGCDQRKRMNAAVDAVQAENLGYRPEHIRQAGRDCPFADPTSKQILGRLEATKNPKPLKNGAAGKFEIGGINDRANEYERQHRPAS